MVLANAATAEVLAQLSGHSYYINNLVFSADGKLLISIAYEGGMGEGTLRMWGIPE